jgi:hypothetical protein
VIFDRTLKKEVANAKFKNRRWQQRNLVVGVVLPPLLYVVHYPQLYNKTGKDIAVKAEQQNTQTTRFPYAERSSFSFFRMLAILVCRKKGIQMDTFTMIAESTFDIKLSPSARVVYLVLRSFSDSKYKNVEASYERIAERANVSRQPCRNHTRNSR